MLRGRGARLEAGLPVSKAGSFAYTSLVMMKMG